MGDRANADPGGSDFTEQDVRFVARTLEDHRGEENAMSRKTLLTGLGGQDRKLRAIIAYLVKHPEEGVCPCHDFKGGVYAAATMQEINKNADWYQTNGVSSIEHASALRRNAARFIAAQPLLFDVGVPV